MKKMTDLLYRRMLCVCRSHYAERKLNELHELIKFSLCNSFHLPHDVHERIHEYIENELLELSYEEDYVDSEYALNSSKAIYKLIETGVIK